MQRVDDADYVHGLGDETVALIGTDPEKHPEVASHQRVVDEKLRQQRQEQGERRGAQ